MTDENEVTDEKYAYLQPVNCRSCGDTNFVPRDGTYVQIAVPARLYDEVIALISREREHRANDHGPVTARQKTCSVCGRTI